MRTLARGIAVACVLMAGVGLRAQEPAPADNASGSSRTSGATVLSPQMTAPWTDASSEQVIIGRDTAAFRKQGTLLSQATREIPKVDEQALVERKLAMYDGARFFRAPTRAGGAPSAPVTAPSAGRGAADDDAWTLRFGGLGWTLAGVLTVGIVVAWRLGWFVPFSARERKAHASQAASTGARSRAAKARGPKIELVKRGG